MPSAQMNAILREIDRFPHAFDFRRDGLGYEMAELVADAIQAGMDSESDPDGARWPDLAAGYAAWKAKHYPGLPMAELEGIMKTPTELQGDLIIASDLMYQTYGVSEIARAHAQWFQDPEHDNQPDRPFYALYAAALAALDDLFDDVFQSAIP